MKAGSRSQGSLGASSLCGACKESCPVDIDLPKLLLRVRAGLTPEKSSTGDQQAHPVRVASNAPGYLNFGMRFFTWVATSPWRFAAAQRMAGIFSLLLAPKDPWLRLPAFTGWGYSKDFPRPAARPFRDLWASRQSVEPLHLPPNGPNRPEEENNIEKVNQLEASREQLIEQFGRELTALGGFMTVCQTRELTKSIIELLQRENIDRLQAWDDSQLPPHLLDDLRAGGITVGHNLDPSLLAGLTGADAAIAESGTLLVTGAPDRPLTASLVPETHIAVLYASRVFATLPEVLNLVELRRSKAAALITGPSRTADIEMTLTVGMHGPREVHVFCVSDC